MKEVRYRPATARSFCQAVVLLLLSLSILLQSGCGPKPSPSPGAGELTVSAAVSLKDAFNEIAVLYEQRGGAKIHFNYGASGALQKQIESGAPGMCSRVPVRSKWTSLTARVLLLRDRAMISLVTLVLIVPANRSTVASFAELNPTVKIAGKSKQYRPVSTQSRPNQLKRFTADSTEIDFR